MNDDIKELNRRNTVTVEQALRDYDQKFSAQQAQIENLQQGLAAASGRITSLETTLGILRAKITGTGPTA